MATSAYIFDIPLGIKTSPLFAKGGFTVMRGLFREEDFQELEAEAVSARENGRRNVLAVSGATEERGGSPCRAFTSAPGRAVQWRLFSAPALLAWLQKISGLQAQPTGGGSFTYYENVGDFLALHRDIITCDLAVITCLKETGSENRDGGLLLYPRHVTEPLAKVRVAGRAAAALAPLRRGDTIALLGGIVPHEVMPMQPHQERVVSVMCYRILPVVPPGCSEDYLRKV